MLSVIAIPAVNFVKVELQDDADGTGIGHLVYLGRKAVILFEAPQKGSHLGARRIDLTVKPPFLVVVFKILKRFNFYLIFSVRAEGWIGWGQGRGQRRVRTWIFGGSRSREERR